MWCNSAGASCHTHVYTLLITLNSGKPQLARTGSPLSTLGLLASILLSVFHLLLFSIQKLKP